MKKEISNNTLRKRSPTLAAPVTFVTKASKYGPTKPPKLPIELIKAMAIAAVDWVRNKEGSIQNGDLKLYIPVNEIVISITAKYGLFKNPVPINPINATRS